MPKAWIPDMIIIQIVFYIYNIDFYQNSACFVHFPSLMYEYSQLGVSKQANVKK